MISDEHILYVNCFETAKLCDQNSGLKKRAAVVMIGVLKMIKTAEICIWLNPKCM